MDPKQQRVLEKTEAYMKKLSIPKDLENDCRELVQNMLAHKAFGNSE